MDRHSFRHGEETSFEAAAGAYVEMLSADLTDDAGISVINHGSPSAGGPASGWIWNMAKAAPCR